MARVDLPEAPLCTCTWPDLLGECTWQLGDKGWERKGSSVAPVEVVRISAEVAPPPPDMCWHSRRSSKGPSWDNQGRGHRQTSRWRVDLCTGCGRGGRRLGRRGKEKDGRARLQLGLEEGAGAEVVDGTPLQGLEEEHILLVQGEGGCIGRGQELCVEEEDELLEVGVVAELVVGQVGGEDTLAEGAEGQGQAAAGWAAAGAP